MNNGSNTDGHYTAGPVGLKGRYETPFLESGPSRYADSHDGKLHPYGAGYDANGYFQQNVDTTIVLGPGLQYYYYSNRVSGYTFQSVFCSGNGCKQMISLYAGADNLAILVAGGEGQDSASHWGKIVTKYNTYVAKGTSTQTPWCWNYARSTGTSNKPSACFDAGDGNMNSWRARY